MRGPRLPKRVAPPIPVLPRRQQLSSSRTLLVRHDKAHGDDVVELAFSRHDPPEKTSMKGPGPIIIMHGLFGSQRNNRTMSK
jgi:hypothetical protein